MYQVDLTIAVVTLMGLTACGSFTGTLVHITEVYHWALYQRFGFYTKNVCVLDGGWGGGGMF